MGMFATVFIDESIELPHFPEELERGVGWQSKQGLDVYSGPYRITGDGRLEKKQQSYRKKTADEKQSEANTWGFDSWKEYTQAYEESDSVLGGAPDAVDGEVTYDDDTENPPTNMPSDETLDEEWWGDISFHGTFEFHELIKKNPIEYEEITTPDGEIVTNENGETATRPSEYALDVFLEYEARFTKGDLDDIVFMGSRHATTEDTGIVQALAEIEDWREWREENTDKW